MCADIYFSRTITPEKVLELYRMDAEGQDLELAIPDGKKIHKNFVGRNIETYDSMLV